MNKRFVAFLMMILFCAKSFGFSLDIDHHHTSDHQTHSYFHAVGQPHSHDDVSDEEPDISEVVISYSDEALEHSNSGLDGMNSFGLHLMLDIPSTKAHERPINARYRTWHSPYLESNTPPPKA